MSDTQATNSDELQGTEDLDLIEDEVLEAEDAVSSDTDETQESTAEVEETPEKKQSGIQRRFKKFSNKIAEQAAELEYWKKAAMGAGTQKVETPAAGKPKLADFDSIEDFIEAREQHIRQELLAELETTARVKTQQATTQQTYTSRVQEVKKNLEDWDEVMDGAADEPAAPETVEFCLSSEVGPKIAYHLAKNPEFHDKLNAMSPVRRIAELGKLEDKLTTVKPQAAKPITKAPGKLTDVSGGGTPVKLSTDAPTSYTEWKKAHDQRQKAAKR